MISTLNYCLTVLLICNVNSFRYFVDFCGPLHPLGFRNISSPNPSLLAQVAAGRGKGRCNYWLLYMMGLKDCFRPWLEGGGGCS